MIVQISSGQGPAECELAVKKIYEALKKDYPDIREISVHQARNKDGYNSVMFRTEEDLTFLEGSILWICKSPYRPHHGRKNWFVDVSVIPEKKDICKEGDIKFEAFCCSGPGGQYINKTSSGVRLIHIPTGITITSTEERSQLMNRKKAMEKLQLKLALLEKKEKDMQKNNAWKEHTKIVRGNPVRIYEGTECKLRK